MGRNVLKPRELPGRHELLKNYFQCIIAYAMLSNSTR
jgi:hypothetical protein